MNATIADLAAKCDDNGCWPLVLLGTNPPRVFDCMTKAEMTLLQTPEALNRFSMPTDEGTTDVLYAVRGNEVVQYHWQKHRAGWVPNWDVAKVDDELRAIDVVDDRLLLFRKAGTVEAQSLETGLSCGTWAMPPTLMGAGCGLKGSISQGVQSILISVRNRKTDMQEHIGK